MYDMSGWINTGLIGIFFFSVIFGFAKGAIKILSFIIAVVIGIILALHNCEKLSLLLGDMIKNPVIAKVVAFIVIFIIVAVVLGFLGSALYKFIHATPIGFLDRLLGLLLGVFLGFVLTFTLLTLTIIFYPKAKKRIENSKLATGIIKAGYHIKEILPKEWQEKILIDQPI